MFTKKNDIGGYKDALEKIKLKTLVHGAKTLMAEFRLEQGAVLPRHKHPHEQTGYLVSGRIDLTIGDVTHQGRARRQLVHSRRCRAQCRCP